MTAVSSSPRRSLTRFAWMSIGAALVTIGLKAAAYQLTGSVGLLSDALESLVNLAGAVGALAMLTVAERPADEGHSYGHDKAEYFASGAEGALIVVAAVAIAVVAIGRLIHPQPLESLDVGVAVSSVAALVNLVVGQMLIRTGRRYDSAALEADGQHLMTDVWTTAGVVVGVGLVELTGLPWIDPVVALLAAANIVRAGVPLMRGAIDGLLDAALPEAERAALDDVLKRHIAVGLGFHAVRTRRAAARRFVSMHVLVPGHLTVAEGHTIAERIEAEVRAVIPRATVFTHVEPIDEAISYADQGLDRD